MIFLFGERTRAAAVDAGQRDCVVCGHSTAFETVSETNYFTVFGIPLLPIEKVAQYERCVTCGNSFAINSHEPSQVAATRQVLAYILAGYGMTDQVGLAAEICQKVCQADVSHDGMRELIRDFASGRADLFELLREQAPLINTAGKQQVITAAFLAVHACCEMQYEDRLRINLIGTALGMPLEFVQACIESVRSAGYLGVRRLTITH
ncbi:MAG: zinc-ribbon domain-containing protein [Pseudomonadota bacterium]